MKLNPKAYPMQYNPSQNENPPAKMKLNPTVSHMQSTTTQNDSPHTKMKLNLTNHHIQSKQPQSKSSQTGMKFPHTTTILHNKVSHMSAKWHHQTPDIFNWTLRHLDVYLEIILEPG